MTLCNVVPALSYVVSAIVELNLPACRCVAQRHACPRSTRLRTARHVLSGRRMHDSASQRTCYSVSNQALC
ncbi:hypothetical protein C8Q78DRAFT_1035097 [Trametes maxima]|nr:hypothetical protein C8Q78DRAFT_1035097 [Trametes maxima]